ncbi:MAG: hypothetical protein ACLUEK_08185 [Oscillospiraceae bacterium]
MKSSWPADLRGGEYLYNEDGALLFLRLVRMAIDWNAETLRRQAR